MLGTSRRQHGTGEEESEEESRTSVLKLQGEGRGRGGGLVNPSSPRSRAEKASVARETLSKYTHVLAVGNWAGMSQKVQAMETQAGEQPQLRQSPINSIK